MEPKSERASVFWRFSRAGLSGTLISSVILGAPIMFEGYRYPSGPDWLLIILAPVVAAVLLTIAAAPLFALRHWRATTSLGWLIVIASVVFAAPVLASLLSINPDTASIWRTAARFALAGAMGGLSVWTFSSPGRSGHLRIALSVSLVAIALPVIAWAVGWRVSTNYENWEAASPTECRLMAQAIREMKYQDLPGAPPLIGELSAGGPCNWPSLGLPLKRLTRREFQASAHKDLSGPYIEHIKVTRPSKSLLSLRAQVEVAHYYGNLGADGFYCTFHRGLTGWKFDACRRAWIS